MPSRLLPWALCALLACGDASSGSEPGADAAPLRCDEQQALTIGHCIDSATEAPCIDFTAETRQFIELQSSGPVSSIIGLQGSLMFVLAVEAEGIINGENESAPLVNIEVSNGDAFVGGFMSRPALIEGDTSGRLRAPQLYVVTFLSEDQLGASLRVQAEIIDQSGQGFCGTGEFEVGDLVDAPPMH